MHLQQMAGVQVGMLLKPSKGIRDDMQRQGKTPKNHMKDNYKHIKQLERDNKTKIEKENQPPKPVFKLKQFQDVKSKISISDIDKPMEPQKNFVQLNLLSIKSSKPASPVQTPKPQKKPGEIPRYLIERKLEWAKREQEKLLMLEQKKIPKGMVQIPDKERLRTLNALQIEKETILQSLGTFPLRIELNSLKKKKQDLEDQLKHVEQGIDLFSRPKVFVPKDEYESSLKL
ncbi:calmodulin-binding-domain-containing protein [Gorgonomyces haynaldii]|nr:calmodulin-binding-domain-containing protein [Gorgonomyces haynaldii]